MSPAGQINLQLATVENAVPLAALHTETANHLTKIHGPGPWSSKTTEKGVLLAMRTSRVYVAWLGTEIVGTFRLTTKKPWAIDTRYFKPYGQAVYLLAMAVAPAMQRQGLGRKCLEEATRIARGWPADVIRLDAYDAKAGAGGFYARCGWTETGRAIYRGVRLIYYDLRLNQGEAAAIAAGDKLA